MRMLVLIQVMRDVEVETEREPVLDLLGNENDETRPQPTLTSEWSETLNDVTVEFSSFTGSVGL